MAESLSREERDKAQQIPMMAMTDSLKPPKSVINLRIVPRTMPYDKLAALLIGATIGIILGLSLMSDKLVGVGYGATFGGLVGLALFHVSPLADESFLTWFRLTFLEKRNQVVENGVKRELYIGLAPVQWAYEGPVKHMSSAIPVTSSVYDNRGYPLTEKVKMVTAAELGGIRDRSKKVPQFTPMEPFIGMDDALSQLNTSSAHTELIRSKTEEKTRKKMKKAAKARAAAKAPAESSDIPGFDLIQ